MGGEVGDEHVARLRPQPGRVGAGTQGDEHVHGQGPQTGEHRLEHAGRPVEDRAQREVDGAVVRERAERGLVPGQLAGVVAGRRAKRQPVVGTTVPTAIPSGDPQFNRQQDQTNSSLLSLAGGTRRGNNYTLDGVPITDLRNRAAANPTIESLDDVKVQVHTYDAEMGRTGGGVFNTTLRSGANSLHGSGFVPEPADLGPDEQLLQR